MRAHWLRRKGRILRQDQQSVKSECNNLFEIGNFFSMTTMAVLFLYILNRTVKIDNTDLSQYL